MTHQNLFQNLRVKYPVFTYESYHITVSDSEIRVEFLFRMGDVYEFKPGLRIPIRKQYTGKPWEDPHFEHLVFQLGMIELISYWKLSCAPLVMIKAGYLNEAQLAWWKYLYYNGMGEFFYVNGIETTLQDFMEIRVEGTKEFFPVSIRLEEACLIPVGGGKDSVVSLELLKSRIPSRPFALNPRKAIEDCLKTAGYREDEPVRYYRSLDPVMIQLNSEGFLNGHTPFSAMLAFTTLLAACLEKTRFILLSNENSANEPTIPGTTINHQYSKSYEFESNFRNYVHRYISPDYEYLSFLRPLNELQIARLFSRFPAYHKVFRSCNVGSKEDIWCGHCPKCLFAAIILSPWLKDAQLEDIFGYPILDNPELLEDLNKLCGNSPEKPFECIGTLDEVNIALCEAIRQRIQLPCLLEHYQNSPAWQRYHTASFAGFMDQLNEVHHLPPDLFRVLTHHYYAKQAD